MVTTEKVSTASIGGPIWRSAMGAAQSFGPIPLPVVDGELEVHPEYQADVRRYGFYDTAYAGGPEYKSGSDSSGCPLLWVHDPLRESPEGFERRKRMAAYVNHVRPIITKFVSYVFRQEIRRDGKDEAFNAWSEDVDGNSTKLNPFMRTAVGRACRLGRYYVAVDSTMPTDGSVETLAQAQAAGVRMTLSYIDPRRMINWRRTGGVLTEAVIVYGAGDLAIHWTRSHRTMILMDDKGKVMHTIGPEPHGWERMPIIEIAPFEGASLVSDIAELNRSLFNIGALLAEELYNCTYSQRVAIGVTAEQMQGVLTGPNRLICIPSDKARIETVGGDPAQADVLRKCLEDTTREIYRAAGLTSEDPLQSGQAKSGVALKVEFNDLAALLAAIAEEAERTESEIVKMYDAAFGADVSAPVYPEDFGTPDAQIELNRSLTVLQSQEMTPTAQLHESRRINRVLHPNADYVDAAMMDLESGEMYGPKVRVASPPAAPYTTPATGEMTGMLAAGDDPTPEPEPPAGEGEDTPAAA